MKPMFINLALWHLLKHQLMQKDWIDFYKDITPPTKGNGLYQNESYTGSNKLNSTEGSAWISNCYFYDMSSSSSGGAISTESVDNFLIEASTFVNCRMNSNSGYGAAIYSKNGNIVLDHVCGTNCYSAYFEGFSDIYGKSSGKSINYVHDSSVAYCVASNQFTMYHYYGHIDIKSVNLSHNEAARYSALTCWPSSTNENNIGTSISYSSFSNNTASSQRCIP